MQDSVNQNREKFLGGSDIACVMGISPWKTRYELLLEKAGIKRPERVSNKYIDYGNTLEPKIRLYVNSKYRKQFIEGKHFHPLFINGVECEDISCRCHTDGEIDDTILEIKTTSVEDKNAPVSDYPDYLVQLLYYMYMNRKKKGILAIYDRPDDMSTNFDPDRLVIYEIALKDYTDRCNEIMRQIERFLIDLEKVKANPELTEEDLLPTEVTETSRKMLSLEDQLFLFKEIEKAYEAEKAKLLQAMQENGIRSWRTPRGILISAIPAKEGKTTLKIDEDAFKTDHPRLYKQYAKPITSKGRRAYLSITHPKEKDV